jgi:hypothetical protein
MMRALLFVIIVVVAVNAQTPYIQLGAGVRDTVEANEMKQYSIDIAAVLGGISNTDVVTFAVTSLSGYD